MGFRRFEDIEAWQDARSLTQEIYSSSREWKDYGLRDQIRRSAVSVMANIAEGFGRGTDKDFARFLETAQASALETASHLYVGLDQGYLSESSFLDLHQKAMAVNKRIGALVKYLRDDGRTGR